MDEKSALSISSHVCHGYVGNRATVFPLQFCGWDVDALNTTNFSNHPGYGKFKGTVSSLEQVNGIFDGLGQILDLSKDYDLIITGYLPTTGILESVFDHLEHIFKSSSTTTWVLDPILGDNGRLYVQEGLVSAYKSVLKSGYVSLITPNQFEFELLSNTSITSWDTLRQAMATFRATYDVRYVVISSVFIEDEMYGVGASMDADSDSVFCVSINQIPCNFNGCGDLFTAILSNSFYSNSCSLSPQVLAESLARLQLILQHTLNKEQEKNDSSDTKSIKDISIVSSRHYLSEKIAPLDSEKVIYL